MKTLYFADVRPHKAAGKAAPSARFLVLIYWPADKGYCILRTDVAFNREKYTNYAFIEVEPTLELPDTVCYLPDGFQGSNV